MSFSIQAMSAYVQRVFTRIPLLRAVRLWLDADGLRMSAAMSFYGMLSLAPLLLLIVGLLGWWVDKAYLESNLIGQVQGVMGERGAEVVRAALASAQAPGELPAHGGFAAAGHADQGATRLHACVFVSGER